MRLWHTRQVHHVRGRRGLRQVHAGAAAGRPAARRGASTSVLTREPGGSPFAEQVRALILDPATRAAFGRCRRRCCSTRRAPTTWTRPSARAGGGPLGDLRPLLGFDPRLPGRRRRAAADVSMRWRAWSSRRRRPTSPSSSTCPPEIGLARARAERLRPARASRRRSPTRSATWQFHERLRAGLSGHRRGRAAALRA